MVLAQYNTEKRMLFHAHCEEGLFRYSLCVTRSYVYRIYTMSLPDELGNYIWKAQAEKIHT